MIKEDMSLFFADFGVIATLGTESALVLIDSATAFINADVQDVSNLDYVVTKQITDLPSLKVNEVITVDLKQYVVRRIEVIDDGQIEQVYLVKKR